jgi:hypothetical protein
MMKRAHFLAVLLMALGGGPAAGPAGAEEPALPGPNPPSLLMPEGSPPDGNAWSRLEQPGGLHGNFLSKVDGQLGILSSRVEVHDSGTASDPFLANKWKTEEEIHLPVLGPLSLFGQVGARCESMSSQELKVASRTGVACKLLGGPVGEMLLRGGPALKCDDPLRPERMKDQSELQIELQYRYALPGQVKVEYQSTAIPALNLGEHDRVNQDLGLAIPLGPAGQFKLGARHSWENTTVVRPWQENMQFYIGLDLKR